MPPSWAAFASAATCRGPARMRQQTVAMDGTTTMMTDAALPPYCEVHGCRGRWDADQPHTLCGKTTTAACRACAVGDCQTCLNVYDDTIPCDCNHAPTTTAAPRPDGSYIAGLREARAVVERQTNLADLVHFDRPSDFRKGVLTCLVALDDAIRRAESGD